MNRLWNQVRSLSTRATKQPSNATITAQEKLSSMEKQILDEYMIPGKFLKYFKAKKQLQKSLKATDTVRRGRISNILIDKKNIFSYSCFFTV